MKVCVIGTRGFPDIEGGVEKHCELLYPLLDRDIDITVFRRKPYVNSNKTYNNIRFIDLPSTKIKGFEAILHSFLATICAVVFRADVVHYHNIGPALFSPLAKLFGIPVVLTFHSPNYEHKKWGGFAKKLLKFSEKVAFAASDRIIFVNRFQMQKYADRIQKKSVYIPNGINSVKLSENKNCLERFGISPRQYILSVGRITPEKGFHTLISAFKMLKRSDITLVIAGGVEFENAYMKELEDLTGDAQVVFTGYVFGDDLAQLYSNAALFVLASENEGFPLVLLEAMSYGLDILASDIPATRLVALKESDYFSTGNIEELKGMLDEKLTKRIARTYELEAFNWEHIAEQVSEIYSNL